MAKYATIEAGNSNHSSAPEFTSVFSGVHVDQSSVFCLVFH